VRQLEDRLGVELFEQLGKSVHLTEAGREVAHTAQRIAAQLDELDDLLAGLKGSGGRLRISFPATANNFMPALLGIFHQRMPEAEIRVDVANREGLLRALEENSVDMVIMGQPPDDLDLEAGRFMDNPLVIVARPDHPLAKAKKRIPLADLESETFLVREHGSGTRIAMERFFRERQVTLTTGMEVGSNEAIKNSVRAGLGLGLLSRDTLRTELELGQLVALNVQHFPIKRLWYVVHRKGKRLSLLARTFKEFMLTEAQGLLDN
ncbi:MAG: LysR family transcriptional regulator, partial [Gammaproteobacteria bacterium]|nr:LysR family transcriptional regulator [Gammaproteobacteria bacterium]